MSDPLIAGASILGSKKLAFMVGAIAATSTGTLSIDIIKNWSVVAAALATAFYVGSIAEGVEKQIEIAELKHEQIETRISTGFVARDYKLDYVYAQATKGNRYTWDMAQKDKQFLEAAIHENSKEDNVRHATLSDALIVISERTTRTFSKLDELHKKCDLHEDEDHP